MQSVLKKRSWRPKGRLNGNNAMVAEIESEIALRRNAEDQKITEQRLEKEQKNLAQTEERMQGGEFEFRMVYLAWFTLLFVGSITLGFLANLWALEAFTTLSFAKRIGIAITLMVLSLIGGTALGHTIRMPSGASFRRLSFSVGVIILTLAVLCTTTISIVRGVDILLLEQSQQQSFTDNSELTVSQQQGTPTAPNFLKLIFVLASLVMGVAGELAAAYSCDQLLTLLIPVWLLSRLRRRVRKLENKLIDFKEDEERARHWPDLVSAREGEEERLGPLALKILITIGITLAVLVILLFLFIPRAHSAPLTQTVICVDCSTSVNTNGEFSKNLQAVENFISRVQEGSHRIVVLGINGNSFQTPPLLSSAGPSDPGRYGERLQLWKRALFTEWTRTKSRLVPSAHCSDHFGAITRAALEFGETKAVQKSLVFLSDMREACQGFNFELPLEDPRGVIDEASRKGLIPSLKGVQVWVLGAHTAGVDARHWINLKVFWSEYFQRAGAKLVAFSPNRRWEQ